MTKALDYFINHNPYCVLGISCNANEMEVIKAHEKIAKLAKLGVEQTYQTNFDNDLLPDVNRSMGVVQSVISTINEPHHKLFWFELPKLLEPKEFENHFYNSMSNDTVYYHYDYFLLSYLQLLILDSSITMEVNWQKLCSVINNYLTHEKSIVQLLYSRTIEQPAQVFSNMILAPLLELIDETDLVTATRLLGITSQFKSKEFMKFNQSAIDLMIGKIENEVNSIMSSSDSSLSEKDNIVRLLSQLRRFSITTISPVLKIHSIPSSSMDRVKSVVFSSVEKIINVLVERSAYAGAYALLHFFKEYAPSHSYKEMSDFDAILYTFKKGETKVKDLLKRGVLPYSDVELYENNDVFVRQLYLSAMGGDGNSAFILGSLYMTPIIKRTQAANVSFNKSKGIYWITKGADLGHKDSLLLLGYCYSVGDGVPLNVAKSNELISKANRIEQQKTKTSTIENRPKQSSSTVHSSASNGNNTQSSAKINRSNTADDVTSEFLEKTENMVMFVFVLIILLFVFFALIR